MTLQAVRILLYVISDQEYKYVGSTTFAIFEKTVIYAPCDYSIVNFRQSKRQLSYKSNSVIAEPKILVYLSVHGKLDSHLFFSQYAVHW